MADLLTLFVTWHKTYKAQTGLLEGPSLHHVMLYNGVYLWLFYDCMAFSLQSS